ncbi:hypothetical protein EIP86_005379 [Pleurotus ostreatoroseus]|nr:hypothetical protein EIP86_005379 [Pleurotus ostreatoroseus]
MAVGPVPPIDFRQRRGSIAPRPRVLSTSSSRPSRVSPRNSPRKQESVPLPRARMNSIVTRGLDAPSSSPSPLAQIYQPFAFDTDRDNDTDQQAEGATSGLNINGYTPRRRMTSIQRRDAMNIPGQSGMRRFPVTSALSESPDDGSNRGGPESLSEVEAGGGGMGLLEKRFDRMEERQKRIEEMA